MLTFSSDFLEWDRRFHFLKKRKEMITACIDQCLNWLVSVHIAEKHFIRAKIVKLMN